MKYVCFIMLIFAFGCEIHQTKVKSDSECISKLSNLLIQHKSRVDFPLYQFCSSRFVKEFIELTDGSGCTIYHENIAEILDGFNAVKSDSKIKFLNSINPDKSQLLSAEDHTVFVIKCQGDQRVIANGSRVEPIQKGDTIKLLYTKNTITIVERRVDGKIVSVLPL